MKKYRHDGTEVVKLYISNTRTYGAQRKIRDMLHTYTNNIFTKHQHSSLLDALKRAENDAW